MDMPDYGSLDDRELSGLRDKVAGLAKSFATTGGFDPAGAMIAAQRLRNLKGGLDPKRRKKAEAAGAALESLGLGQPSDQETLSALLKTLDGLTSDAPQRL
jgi:hypothetical protein